MAQDQGFSRFLPMVENGKKGTIAVYVRKGVRRDDRSAAVDDFSRVLSFRIPSDLKTKDILDRGFAIDGNTALAVIKPFTVAEAPKGGSVLQLTDVSPDSLDFPRTIIDALYDAESLLANWLSGLGYDVEFK